jgi:hypothetical protein
MVAFSRCQFSVQPGRDRFGATKPDSPQQKISCEGVGGDKGFQEERFLAGLRARGVVTHVAVGSCKYTYNLPTGSLSLGYYEIDIPLTNSTPTPLEVGSVFFTLD